MQKSIGEILSELRSGLELSQRDVAERLRAYGVEVSNQAVSKWENGQTQPNASQFLALCRVLNVDDVMSVFAGRGVSKLNREGQRLAADYVKLLIASGLYSNAPKRETHAPLRLLPLYDVAVSAGTGQFLEDSAFEQVEVGDEVPLGADFGLRIAGNSMEPRYSDGQIVWVSRRDSLLPGEIGVFLLRGEAYCKKLTRSGGRVFLSSLNSSYSPIEVSEHDELRTLGKVLS